MQQVRKLSACAHCRAQVLETELQKGSNYKKFRRRERQAEYLASQGKALVYMPLS